MRKIYALAFLCFACTCISAQVNINEPWVWVANNNRIPNRPSFGTKGVASPTNTPGGRKEAMVWHDEDITWVFGGYGYAGNSVGYLNDLWKHDASTNQWTLMSGDNAINQSAVYGTVGVPGTLNKPGSRRNACGLVDQIGNLWLFSGYGYDGSSALGALTDLWKYDPLTNEWTWYAGPNTVNYGGNTGSLGVSSPGNWPAGRHGASFWQDGLGKIWVFGGHGSTSGNSALDDLWKFDPNIEEWTWMGNGGPNARGSAMCWSNEMTGDLYLFGGISGGPTVSNPAAIGSFNLNQGTRFNDMWKYSQVTNSWTEVRSGTNTAIVWGTKGVFDPTNQPGRKNGGAVWKDADGNFWLQGGTGPLNNTGSTEYYHDVWKYDVASNQWAWMNGGTNYTADGTFGTLGVGDINNIQYSFKGASSWVDDNGKFWMFGGESNGFFPGVYRNTVWMYDPLTNETTWIKGDNNWHAAPVGTMGVADPANGPGERSRAGSWYDNNGNLWLFGGQVTATVAGVLDVDRLGDLWKYNITSGQWTWMHGQTAPISSNYGTTGVASATNRPAARIDMITWTDNSNNLWMFSGQSPTGLSDDLWKYDIASNQWTFVKGNKSSSSIPVYGSQGIADPANTPGWRLDASSWKDNSGDLWLFGGRNSNDLWRYNIAGNQWTWIKGSNIAGQPAVYGTKGTAHINNTPGARQNCSSWKDNLGNLWLFGGDVNGVTYRNELWKYDPSTNEWTWMHGDNIANILGVYGVRGTPTPINCPGARSQSVNWTDAFGNFWLMGGLGYDINGNFGELNDLWMYNVSTNEWVWVKGDETIAHNGVYGTKGIPHAANKPGSRYGAISWTDGLNNFWLYGGTGYGELGNYILSDLWKIESPLMSALPVRLLEFKGQLVNNEGVLNWKTENEENASSYTVERSTDLRHYIPVGTIAAKNMPGKHNYSLTDPGTDALGAKVVYYKLKQQDIDGRATYSNIIALTIDKSSFVLFYPNPVKAKANVTITLDRAEQVKVRVISNTGAVVQQLQWALPAGSIVKDIDLDGLPAGQYYLDLSGERLSKRISFVKQ